MKIIKKNELEFVLNILEKANFDDCLNASLHSSYSQVNYHKGFEACICCLKDYFELKKDLDIISSIVYF